VPASPDGGAGGADGGPPAIDAGLPAPGGDCSGAIDVSSGGTFVVDTCTGSDEVGATCAALGARDALLVADAPFSGSTYFVRVPAEWVVQQVDDACSPMAWSCGAGSWGVSGAVPWARWRFAVQRADGACGSVAIEVERAM
jgi:hypothetical protein